MFSQLFTQKYQPKQLAEVQGQEAAVQLLKDFVLNYKKQKKKALLLHGPVGCGKTSLVHALARELDYEIIEVNASDTRNEKSLQELLGPSLKQQSLFSRSKIILVDEIDNVSGREDRGAISTLSELIEGSHFPIILTANEIDENKLKPLKKICQVLALPSIETEKFSLFLQEICHKETLPSEEKALKSLARRSGSDLRAGLIDLQTLATKKNVSYDDLKNLYERQRKETVQNALRLVFKTTDPQLALRAFDNLDLELKDVYWWMEENLPQEYQSREDLANAYQTLSRTDMFLGRIHNRQHWGFLVYINQLLSAGIALSKSQKSTFSGDYKETKRFLKMWMAKQRLAKRKALCEKMAGKLHCSSSKLMKANWPYLEIILQNTPEERLAKEFHLGKEEIEWIKER